MAVKRSPQQRQPAYSGVRPTRLPTYAELLKYFKNPGRYNWRRSDGSDESAATTCGGRGPGLEEDVGAEQGQVGYYSDAQAAAVDLKTRNRSGDDAGKPPLPSI